MRQMRIGRRGVGYICIHICKRSRMSKVESVRISVTLSTCVICKCQEGGRFHYGRPVGGGGGKGRFLFMEERAIMRHGVSYDAR